MAKTFRSIRYATGARFAEPEAVNFDGIYPTSSRGPICPQNPSRLENVIGPQAPLRQDEECRVLSVTTRSCHGRRPVVVWLHGGAYLTGGGELPWYDGDALVNEHDVVFVSVSYRLGAFGYLRLPGAQGPSLGLADQIAALNWVKRHIEQFGGDPNAVTVAGQSAGAHSIRALIEWGHGGILFKRAIMHSSPGLPLLSDRDAARIYRDFETALAKDPRAATVAELLAAQNAVASENSKFLAFSPIAPSPPFKQRQKIDALVTWTKHDARPFVTKSRTSSWLTKIIANIFSSIATRRIFEKGARQVAAIVRTEHGYAELIKIGWSVRNNPLQACHCIELPLLMGTNEAWLNAPMLIGANEDELRQAGIAMRSLWSRVMHSGTDRSWTTDEARRTLRIL